MRLLRLVNNLIDTTKVDAGFYKPNFSEQDIVRLIKRISMSVSDYSSGKIRCIYSFINKAFEDAESLEIVETNILKIKMRTLPTYFFKKMNCGSIQKYC